MAILGTMKLKLNLHLVRLIVIRVGAFISGVVVLYHEVFLASSAEPLLVFLGLWLCGIPPAMFFDGLRKLTDTAKGSLEDTVKSLEDVTDQTPTEQPHET